MKPLKTFYKTLQKLNLSNKPITIQLLEDIQSNNIPDCLPKYLKHLNTKNIKEKKLINYIFRNSDDINKLILVNTNIHDFTSNDFLFQIEAVYLSLYIDEVGMYLSEYIVNFIMTEIKSHKLEFMEKEFQTIENYDSADVDNEVNKASSENMTPLISFDAFNMSITPFRNKISSKNSDKIELIAKIILFLCSQNFLQKSKERYTLVMDIFIDTFKFYPYSSVIEESIYIGLLLMGRSVTEDVLNIFMFKRAPKEETRGVENISMDSTAISHHELPIMTSLIPPYVSKTALYCNSSLEFNGFMVLLIEKYIPIEKINVLIINKLVITMNSNSFEKSFLASRLLLKILNSDPTCYCRYNKIYEKTLSTNDENCSINTPQVEFKTNTELETAPMNSPHLEMLRNISVTHQEIYNKLLKFQDDPDFELIYDLPFKNITNIKFFNSDSLKSTLKKIDLISTNLKICTVCYHKDIGKNQELIKNYTLLFYDRQFHINLLNLQELSCFTSQHTIYLIINLLLRNDIKCLFLENLLQRLKQNMNIQILIKIILLNNQYIEKNKPLINEFFCDYIPSNIPLSFIEDFVALYSLNILYTLNEIVEFIYKKVVIKNVVIPKTTLNRILNFFRALTNKQVIDKKYINLIIQKYKVIECSSEFDDIEIIGETINPVLFKRPFAFTNVVECTKSESIYWNKLEAVDQNGGYINDNEATPANISGKSGLLDIEINNKHTNHVTFENFLESKKDNIILTKYPFRGKYPCNNPLNDLQLYIILEATELKLKILIPEALSSDSFSINIAHRYLKLSERKIRIKTVSFEDIGKLLQFDFIHENNQRKLVTPIKFRINVYKTAFIASETFESKYSDFGIRRFNDLFEEYFMSFRVTEKNTHLMRLKYLDDNKCITEIFDKLVIGKKRGEFILFKTSDARIMRAFNQKT